MKLYIHITFKFVYINIVPFNCIDHGFVPIDMKLVHA